MENITKMRDTAHKIVKSKGNFPTVKLTEKSDREQKGCFWKVIKEDENSYYITFTNLGKSDAEINLSLANERKIESIENVLTGEKLPANMALKPYDTYLLKVVF